jgi:Arc/MetJ-type ribon-helix-helix transcriptional regulator
MQTIVCVKFTKLELEVIDLLRGGTHHSSRAEVIRQAIQMMARKRHVINAAEALKIAADRDDNHPRRRNPRSPRRIAQKGRKA